MRFAGPGDPVVLIHLAPYADSFLPLMDQPGLAGYQLIRYRRRGYGSSPAKADRVTIPTTPGTWPACCGSWESGAPTSSAIPMADWSGCSSRRIARRRRARWC